MRKAPKELPLLLVLLPGLLGADSVYLKSGGRFSGRILEQTPERVVIDFGDGKIGVPMSDVEHIEKGTSPLDEFEAKAKTLAADDVNGC